MCGLVGVAGNIGRKEEQVFRTLLILDTIRGDHSTGVAFIDRWSKAKNAVVKEVGPPANLFRNQDYINQDKIGTWKALIGHNRFATRGAVNAENAHPFHRGHIIGAHNGTLDNKWNFPDQEKFQTDSEAFYNMVSEKGIDAAVQNSQGAWAFTFWNEEEDTINLLRNKERTLYFCTTKNNDCFLWASEEWMLHISARRVGLEINPIHLLKEDNLLTIPLNNQKMGRERIRPLAGKPKSVVVYSNSFGKESGNNTNRETFKKVLMEVLGTTSINKVEYYAMAPVVDKGQFGDDDILMYKSGSQNTPKLKFGDLVEGDVNVYKTGAFALPLTIKVVSRAQAAKVVEKKYHNHKGNEITREEWEDTYKYCTWCNSDLDPDDSRNLMMSNGDVLCHHCQQDKDVKELIQLEK